MCEYMHLNLGFRVERRNKANQKSVKFTRADSSAGDKEKVCMYMYVYVCVTVLHVCVLSDCFATLKIRPTCKDALFNCRNCQYLRSVDPEHHLSYQRV